VVEVGEVVPDATVFGNPGEAVSLRALAAEGPVLLVFYLLDWSST
jgi:peroxiredoxin